MLIQKMPPDTAKVNRLFQLCLSLNWNDIPGAVGQLADEAMLISKKTNFTKGKGLALYIKGFVYYGQRNYQKALDTVSYAMQILQSAADITNSGHCNFLMAHINYDMGDYPNVMVQSEAALAKWKTSGFTALNGVCNNDMALACIRMGRYNKTVEYALKAYRECKAVSNKQGMAQSLQLMGSSFYDFKNYAYAFKNIKAASLLNLELKDSFAYARNNNMLGEIYLDQNDCDQAMKTFRESFAIYSRAGAPPWGQPWGYSNIGSVYEKIADQMKAQKHEAAAAENYRTALGNYLQSLQKFNAIKDPAGSTEQMMLLGRTYFKTNNISLAKKYLTTSLALALQIGEKRHLASSYLYLSKVDSAENNIPLAYKHYQMHVACRDSVYNQQSLQSLLALKAQEDVDKKDNEIALLETENKLEKALSEKRSQGRNFAYLLAALLLVAGTYGYFRFKKQSKIKAGQKLLKERLAISQDLHDNIGSTLSSVSVYSQVARIHGANKEYAEMNELLEKISKASGETVAEMNDIVWAINPRNDNMEKIIERMASFTGPLAAARNIHFNLEYDQPVLLLQLDMDKRKNFYLIFKEAVTNAIKYSGAAELSTNIRVTDKNLILTVKDNGTGFNAENEMAGNKLTLSGYGLYNMHKRAKELNGQLTINSSTGSGTEVMLTLPID
ncbi:MAG: hypothetical protein JNM14_11660 [Ferruginibacter sp.]|nr:hypothetical protein [Ferruginibacter sp.]